MDTLELYEHKDGRLAVKIVIIIGVERLASKRLVWSTFEDIVAAYMLMEFRFFRHRHFHKIVSINSRSLVLFQPTPIKENSGRMH